MSAEEFMGKLPSSKSGLATEAPAEVASNLGALPPVGKPRRPGRKFRIR
jgi:hypothetical protein